MPRTVEDVETYLLNLNRQFYSDAGTYIVNSGSSQTPIAIRVEDPIVAVRVEIGPVPSDTPHQAKFFRRLLEYNARDLMHASYGIEDTTVVLAAALELENLDMNELEAT